MKAPRKLARDLYRLETTVTDTEMPLALYLLAGESWLATDTGCVGMMRDLAIPAAEELRSGSHIGRAFVSHAHGDHFGGNAELQEARPDCRIYVHRKDADWAREPDWHVREAYAALGADYPCPAEVSAWVRSLLGEPAPVVPVETGYRLPLDDGRTLHTVFLPGHSPGHAGLWEPEERVLLMSDALLGSGQRVEGKVVAIPAYLDVAAYLASIRTVRALAPELCCPSHFPEMDGATTQDFCDESESFVRRLDEIIRGQLSDADRPLTLRELTSSAVPKVAPDAQVSMVAGLTVQAHLDALERHGLLSWQMAGDVRTWSAI